MGRGDELIDGHADIWTRELTGIRTYGHADVRTYRLSSVNVFRKYFGIERRVMNDVNLRSSGLPPPNSANLFFPGEA